MRALARCFVALCLISIVTAKVVVQTDALQAVSNGVNQFSTSFFQKVSEKSKDNLIMSPLSAAIVLSMAAYGAGGKTKEQMKSVLHLPHDDDLGKRGMQKLIDISNNVKDIELRLANKIFTAEKFSVKLDYKALTETYFRSTCQSINFGKPAEAAKIINTWVEQQTKNRIKNLISAGALDLNTMMVLVNAVYFKGQWKDKFNKQLTQKRPFYTNPDIAKNVPTMYRLGSYKYAESPALDAKIVELPYKGGQFSMVLVVPNKLDGLAKVERRLPQTDVHNLLKRYYQRKMKLYVPKYTIESKLDLNDILKRMGLTNMFTPYADFSGIANKKLKVDKVVQKAFIEVNEEGSEAAAATAIQMVATSAIFRPKPIMVLKVDRPFHYMIRDTSTGVVFFEGRVTSPSTK